VGYGRHVNCGRTGRYETLPRMSSGPVGFVPRSRNRGRPYNSEAARRQSAVATRRRASGGTALTERGCNSDPSRRYHRKPASRGRFLLRRGYGGQVEDRAWVRLRQGYGATRCCTQLPPTLGLRRDTRGLYTFLRNEPTVFHRNLLCNLHCMSDLWLKFIREFGGFVLENEPTGGVF
jgi:hypothetical protein